MQRERIGDLETDLLQDMVQAVCKKYGTSEVNLTGDVSLLTNTGAHKTSAKVFDHGRLVFSATRWKDGDQIVSSCQKSGGWRSKLHSAAQ